MVWKPKRETNNGAVFSVKRFSRTSFHTQDLLPHLFRVFMIDHTSVLGVVFGRLTPLLAKKVCGITYYECSCSCGGVKDVIRQNLLKGMVTSCGCLKRGPKPTYTKSKTPEYRAWNSLRQRCTNPSRKDYKYYGGRGISFDPNWTSFEVFLADVGLRPSSKHELDREKNHLGYSKENCRWVTKAENNENRDVTIRVLHQGCLITLKDLEALTGTPYKTLYNRYRAGTLNGVVTV